MSPSLAFVFALVLAGYTVWDLDRLSGSRHILASESVSLAGAPASVPAIAGAEPAAVASGVEPAGDFAAADALSDPRGGRPSARDLLLADGTTVGCRIAMGVTMAFMLLIMI